MAALTGHRTDRPAQRTPVNRKRLRQKREEVEALLRAPLIDASLLSDQERHAIHRAVKARLRTMRADANRGRKSYGWIQPTRSGRKWALPFGMAGYRATPGPYPEKQPQYLKRRQRLQGGSMLEQYSFAVLVSLARLNFSSLAPKSVSAKLEPKGTREYHWAWRGATRDGRQVVSERKLESAIAFEGAEA